MQTSRVLRASALSPPHRSITHASRIPSFSRHYCESHPSSSRVRNALSTKIHAAHVRLMSTKPEQNGTPTDTKSADPVKTESSSDSEVPMLRRPLGVSEKPTSGKRTWEQTKEELLDQDKRMEKRKHLLREATKGYFSDLNATRRHGGKTWIAPKVMIRENKALYFPDIVGTSLQSGEKVHTTDLCTGKVSVISILSTRISELQAANFTTPTHSEFSKHPSYQYIQVNLQENLLKSLLVSMFLSGIKKTVPEELWPTYLVSSQNMDYSRYDLGMTNRHIGYVYLVDDQCRVRWAGCADPKPEETEALRVCTGILLDRLEESKAPGGQP